MSDTKRAWLLTPVVLALFLLAAESAAGGDGAVALQSCDVSCPDGSSDFYVACGNGTVTDNRTGLVWLADADCFGELAWGDAMAVVAGLGDLPASACVGMGPDECDCGLNDRSAPGEWRLPTMADWKAMISVGWDTDSCSVAIANDVGNGCWNQACADAGICSFHDVQASLYWSASAYVADPSHAWMGELGSGVVVMLPMQTSAHVWPVRGGQ